MEKEFLEVESLVVCVFVCVACRVGMRADCCKMKKLDSPGFSTRTAIQ